MLGTTPNDSVKNKIPKIPTTPTMTHSATSVTPDTILTTPVIPLGTRQSSELPTIATGQDREVPKLFSPFTDDSKTFHVFPHKGSALAEVSVIVSYSRYPG